MDSVGHAVVQNATIDQSHESQVGAVGESSVEPLQSRNNIGVEFLRSGHVGQSKVTIAHVWWFIST